MSSVGQGLPCFKMGGQKRYECDNAVHNNYDDDCGEGEDSEDDCIISLPDEMGNNSFDDDLDYNSGEDDNRMNKRQRTCV